MANTVTTPGAVGYKPHYAEIVRIKDLKTTLNSGLFESTRILDMNTGDVYGLKAGELAQTVIGSVTKLLGTVLDKK